MWEAPNKTCLCVGGSKRRDSLRVGGSKEEFLYVWDGFKKDSLCVRNPKEEFLMYGRAQGRFSNVWEAPKKDSLMGGES